MTNRPKNIGTAAETAVVRAARLHGFPNADRLTLTGNKDRGDIGLCPGVILEVKGGAAAKDASDTDIERWLAETETERGHAGAEYAFLVTQRRGVGAPNAVRWWAWTRLSTLYSLTHVPSGVADEPNLRTFWSAPIRMQLGDLFGILRGVGYGTPFPDLD